MMKLGQCSRAIEQAIRLADKDERRLWNYLRAYSSTVLNFRETNPLLVVHALWTNWTQERDVSFISHTVLTRLNTQQGESALEYYNRSGRNFDASLNEFAEVWRVLARG